MATNGSAALTALGDPRRQAIVEQLAAQPLAVSELAARLPISRPAVSQHLKVLAEAGVVGCTSHGTRRVYHLDPAGLAAVRQYLDGFWRQALGSFAALAEDTAPAEPAFRAHFPDLPVAPDVPPGTRAQEEA